MKVTSRLYPVSSMVLDDLERGLHALERLPGKIGEMLHATIPEYSSHQEALDLSVRSEPACVVVLGEGLYFLSAIVEMKRLADPEFFLNSFPHPYCILGLDRFERAVEVAATNNISLHELLVECWRLSRDTSPKEHRVEDFGGRDWDRKEQFVQKYVEELLPHLRD